MSSVIKMYSVYDKKAGSYQTPFFQPSDGVATRAFQEAISDKNSLFSKYPDDFSLFFVASFNVLDGSLSFLEKPTLLVKATSLVSVVK